MDFVRTLCGLAISRLGGKFATSRKSEVHCEVGANGGNSAISGNQKAGVARQNTN